MTQVTTPLFTKYRSMFQFLLFLELPYQVIGYSKYVWCNICLVIIKSVTYAIYMLTFYPRILQNYLNIDFIPVYTTDNHMNMCP
jgi:hypothetical protein